MNPTDKQIHLLKMRVAILEDAFLKQIRMTYGVDEYYMALEKALNRIEAEGAEVSSMQNQSTINPVHTQITPHCGSTVCNHNHFQ